LQLQNVAHNTHCIQQNKQCLLNKTAVFQRVGSYYSDIEYHKWSMLHLVFKVSSTWCNFHSNRSTFEKVIAKIQRGPDFMNHGVYEVTRLLQLLCGSPMP